MPTVGINPTAPTVQGADWSGLWLRTQRSLVTALDLARILVFDAVILVMGNGLVHLTTKWIDADDGFVKASLRLSHGLFLLLYFILVCAHVIEFFKGQRRKP